MFKHKNPIFILFFILLLKYTFTVSSYYNGHIDIPFDYMENPQHDPGKITDMQVDLV